MAQGYYRIEDKLDELLERVADRTGRSKAYLVGKFVERGLAGGEQKAVVRHLEAEVAEKTA